MYEIASIAKSFTAAAILRLAEEGALSLDDPVKEHLPGVLPEEIARQATIRHLITLTSGIRDFPTIPEFRAIEREDLPRDTLLKLIAAHPLEFAPGTAQAYSNSGYTLLSHIIERVTGKSWEEYVEQELFAKAGMADSRVSKNMELVPRLTSGYRHHREAGLQPAMYIEYKWTQGAGGLRSTAGDVVAWLQALHDGNRILGPKAYRDFVTPYRLNDGTFLRYAAGIKVDTILGHPTYIYDGDFPGHASLALHLPDDTLSVVVLMNSQGAVSKYAVAQRVVREVLGDRAPKISRSPQRTKDYVGEYRVPASFSHPYFHKAFQIAADSAGQLTVSINGRRAIPLVFLGGERFSVGRDGDITVTFIREGARVVGARWDAGIFNVPFERQPSLTATPETRKL